MDIWDIARNALKRLILQQAITGHRSKRINTYVLKMMEIVWSDYKIAAINIFKYFKRELSNKTIIRNPQPRKTTLRKGSSIYQQLESPKVRRENRKYLTR